MGRDSKEALQDVSSGIQYEVDLMSVSSQRTSETRKDKLPLARRNMMYVFLSSAAFGEII